MPWNDGLLALFFACQMGLFGHGSDLIVKRGRSHLLVVLMTSSLIEMALAFDVGVLEAVGPAPKLTRRAF